MIDVSKLTGPKLNYWVAKADGAYEKYVSMRERMGDPVFIGSLEDWICYSRYNPSIDWSQGGPIIDREDINILRVNGESDDWGADIGAFTASTSSYSYDGEPEISLHPNSLIYGPTPLIAAIRCFVASKFGPKVKELKL